jgi:poly(3-hydroxybutyrate) depolymerase
MRDLRSGFVSSTLIHQTFDLVDPDREVGHTDSLSEPRPIGVHVFTPRGLSRGVPLVVFCHGFTGHPRKFRSLLERWAAAGFCVVAPVFPLTSDEGVGDPVLDDVAHQPADVRFVLDSLEAGEPEIDADMARIGVGGFSLGGITALSVGFGRSERDERVRAIAAFACRAPDFDVLEPKELPLLMAHGTEDVIVPYEGGRAVFDAAAEPKEWIEIAGGAHHEVFEDGYERPTVVDDRSTEFWLRFLR